MQWYEIISLISSFFAIITFSVFSFNCFISIKHKLPARVKVSYDKYALPFSIFYCREFQDFIVFIPCRIKNKSHPKGVIIHNPLLSYYSKGNIVKTDPESPYGIKGLKSLTLFYEKFHRAFYGNYANEITGCDNLIIFPFVVTDKTLIDNPYTSFTISFDLHHSFKQHFKKEIVLPKSEIGPYSIQEIEKDISKPRLNPFYSGTYEDIQDH